MVLTEQTALISFARSALGLDGSIDLQLSPLGKRGSDRVYFRVRWDQGHSAILVSYDAGRIENAYFADIALFLADIAIPVPRVIRHDPTTCLIAMEDLGDKDLWSCRGMPWQDRRRLYEKTLTVIGRLHCFPLEHFPGEQVRLMEEFNSRLYQWERDYFRTHFVQEFCGVGTEPAFETELERELSALAGRLQRGPRSLVHRDLQSQNVMVRDGDPILIDFQGMRKGSPFYDLGSLLCDPYVDFPEGTRDELLLCYYGLANNDLEWPVFRKHFWEASIQRLMQALGAYAFLGLRKGLEAYFGYIPAALNNLHYAAVLAGSVPYLQQLCENCTGTCASHTGFRET